MTTPPAFERHFTSTAYIVSGGRTLLLWHAKLRTWLPPGGHLEANEDPVQGAVREALEESGLAVEVMVVSEVLPVDRPVYLPPPAAVGVFDIEVVGQPFHQHIDFVYFTRPLASVDFDAPTPEGMHRWATADELAGAFSLPAPDGTLVPVAEDVRLLGVRAIAAAKH